MKLSLVVLTPGKMQGTSIPITLSQFLIGRDPQCHLRPASALISKRHCAVLVRGEQAFVHDFDSTNGTLVNDEPVIGEKELMPNDRLKVGPLEFCVGLEKCMPVSKLMPAQSAATLATSADEVRASRSLRYATPLLRPPSPNGKAQRARQSRTMRRKKPETRARIPIVDDHQAVCEALGYVAKDQAADRIIEAIRQGWRGAAQLVARVESLPIKYMDALRVAAFWQTDSRLGQPLPTPCQLVFLFPKLDRHSV
jgi:predicted component of type VI protein secretion system